MTTHSAPAFIAVANPTIDWPVRVSLPVSGGEVAEFEFTGTFRVLSEEAFRTTLPNRSQEDTEKMTMSDVLAENARILPSLISGWNVRDENGNAVPISMLPDMLTGPYGRALSIGINRAVAEIRAGVAVRPSATLGNSPTARVTGSDAPQVEGEDRTSSPTT